MKAIEILAESRKKVSEAPANIVGQGLKRLGAGVLSAMGAKHMAGGLQGSAELGAKANELEGEFQRYLAQTGKSAKTAEYSDLQAFFKKNKISSKLANGQGPIDQKTVDNIFRQIAQSGFKGSRSSASTTTPSSSTATTTPSQSNIAAPQATATQSTSAQSATQQYPAGQARKDADALIQNISKVRSRDRQKIVDYIKQKLDGLGKAPQVQPQPVAQTPAPVTPTATASRGKPVKIAGKKPATPAKPAVAV